MRYETATDIAAAQEAVWAVMADVQQWPQWTASVSAVELLDEGPLRLGSRARVKQPGFPAAVWQVTGFAPGEGFVWQNRTPGLTSTGDHRVRAAGDGTSVAVLSITQTGPLSFVARAFAARTRRYVQLEAEGLRRRCESDADGAAADITQRPPAG